MSLVKLQVTTLFRVLSVPLP